jgi:hypothetical protein
MIDKVTRWNYTAQIGFANSNVNYWGQYDELIKFIYEAFPKENSRFETIAIPLLHLISHSLELGCKENIDFLLKYSETKETVEFKKNESYIHNHNLLRLLKEYYGQFGVICRRLDIKDEKIEVDFKMYYSKAVQLIEILNTTTETYRYAYKINNNGAKIKNIIHFNKTVDLFEIKELFFDVSTLLLYTSNVLSYWTDYYDYTIKFPKYKKGVGYLKKPKLFVESKEFQIMFIERLGEQFERRDENLWYDSEENEFMEVQVDGTDFYVIVINHDEFIK